MRAWEGVEREIGVSGCWRDAVLWCRYSFRYIVREFEVYVDACGLIDCIQVVTM